MAGKRRGHGWQDITVIGIICSANVIHVKMGKAKNGKFCSIFDDLCLKRRVIFTKRGAIVSGF